jgi:predicted DNA-binding transcriptional regulator AlpA
VPKIVGVLELVDLLGVTRQRVWQLIKRADFPEPCYRMKAGDFWLLADIEAWATATGRKVNR